LFLHISTIGQLWVQVIVLVVQSVFKQTNKQIHRLQKSNPPRFTDSIHALMKSRKDETVPRNSQFYLV